MLHIAVTAETRPERLTKSARKILRAKGGVLASVYGKGRPAVSVILSAADLSRVLSAETGENTLIDLSIQGRAERQLARLDSIEMEPITNRFRHVGLHTISALDSQKGMIQVNLVGEPASVHSHTAILETGAILLEVSAMPEDMVGRVDVNVAGMVGGDVIHAGDILLPPGVTLVSDPALAVASLHLAAGSVSAETRQQIAEGDTDALSGIKRNSSSFEEDLQNV